MDEELAGLFRERPNVFVLLTLWSTRNEIFGRRPAWIDDPLLRETFTDEDITLLENPAVGGTRRRGGRLASCRAAWRRSRRPA